MADKKIFVTGGNGFIGSRLVTKLIEHGCQVRCLLRPSSETVRIDHLPIERVYGDVRDSLSLNTAMKGCDGVIHLASISNWADMQSNLMSAVVKDGTSNVLQAAMNCGMLRTVYVSSIIAINGTDKPGILNEESQFTLPKSKAYSYAFAKRDAEACCQNVVKQGLPVVIINPGEVYGPNDSNLVTAGNLLDFAQSPVVLVPEGGTSVVHIDDVVSGIIAAFEKGQVGKRYILGGENLTIYELAKLSIELFGQDKRIFTVPNTLIHAVAKMGQTLHIPLPFEPAVIPYAVKYWFADNTRAREELGINFRSAIDTLEPTIRWLQASQSGLK